MSLVNYIKKIFLLLTVFIVSSCSSGSNNKNSITIAYSELDSKLASLLTEKLKHNSKIKFQKIEQIKCIDFLHKSSNSMYLGSIDPLITNDDEISKIIVAKDSLVFVVNPSNPIDNLNKEDLSKIFLGSMKSWSKLKGTKQPITVINKAETHADNQTLSKFLQKDNLRAAQNQFIANTNEEALALVQQYENSISYVSFSSIDNRVKAINLNNIAPTILNINSGNFPLYRVINLYYSSNLYLNEKVQDEIKELTEYLWSEDFKHSLNELKLVSLTQSEIQIIKENNKAVKIGVSGPLSGPYTELGRSIVNGARLAVQEQNRKANLKGKPVELIICDDKAAVASALDCANKFLKEKVAGVIGHLNSNISIEASKIYINNGIIQISPGSTHPWLTNREEARGKVFRTIDIDERQALTLARAVANLPKLRKNIAILHNGTIYGSNLATLIENYLLRNVSETMKIESLKFDVSGKHFYHVFKHNTPNIVIFIGEYADAAQMLVDLALDNKSDVTFFGADGNFSKRFIQLAGLRAEGAHVLGCNIDDQSNDFIDFEKKYNKIFKHNLSSFSIYSYDATRILINAIVAHNRDKSKSLSSLIQNSVTESLCGPISFDEYGNPEKSRIAIYKVQDGQFIKTKLGQSY